MVNLLKVMVNLFSIEWLNVDISVLPWAHFATLTGFSIFNFFDFAECLSVFEFAFGLLKLIAQMAMFSVLWLRVVVAVFATVEGLLMVMVLRFLNQEIAKDRELLSMMDTLMDGHLMLTLFTVEKRSLTVKGHLDRFLVHSSASATVIVSALVSLVNSMLMEVSWLKIVLIIVMVVKFGMDFSFVVTRFVKDGFGSCHSVTDIFFVKTFAKDMFTTSSVTISTFVANRSVTTSTFVTNRSVTTSTFVANRFMTGGLTSDSFLTFSFASDALVSIAFVTNRHMFSDAFMTDALVASGSFVASLKKTFLISEKRVLLNIMASSFAILWSMVEVILHFIVVEIMRIVVFETMVHSAFMEMDWLNIMGIVKSVLQAMMIIEVSMHMHLEVCRMVTSDLSLLHVLG